MLGVRTIPLPFVLLFKLCGDYHEGGPEPEPDAGSEDAGSDAAAARDGSAEDDASELSDAGVYADSALPDANVSESDAAADAGAPPDGTDAGTPAAEPEGGVSDASTESDAGVELDAGSNAEFDGSADASAGPDASVDASAELDAGEDASAELDGAPDANVGSDAAAADGGAELDARAADASTEADSGALVLSGPPGLYLDVASEELAPGVRPYAPRYALWADGADKERFVVMPEGATIDASDPDLWRYPVGTRFYKTFSLDGQRLETRVMEKMTSGFGPATWSFRAYAWLADQRGVELVGDDGRANVLGSPHDIPSVAQCRNCHGAAGQDAVNGFSAIQLNHGLAGVTLGQVLEEGSLASPLGELLLASAIVPGDELDQAALGYLHANCGNCHGGPTPRAGMTLRLSVGQTAVPFSGAYLSAVGQPLRVWTGRIAANGESIALRVAPGDAAASAIVARMSVRGSRDQMPSVGTEVADPAGIAAVSAWIDSL